MGTSTGSPAAVRGALLAAAVLVATAPTPLASLRTLTSAGEAQQVTDPLVALVALLAWSCAAYLLVVAALTLGSRLPGVAGTALGAVARVSAPAGLRRAVGLALGVTLAVGALAGPASATGPGPSAPATGTVQAPATPSLDHPGATPSPSLDHPVASPSPSLDHPVASPAVEQPAAAPHLDWPGSARPAAAPAPAAEPAAAPVVVQPGDSLWELAEEHLERTGPQATDAQVAQAWPSWWQANREAVGDDPDLLRPGTPLVPPPPAAPPTDT